MKRFWFVIALLVVVLAFPQLRAFAADVEYPMPTVSDVSETGIIFNRKGDEKKAEQESECPGGVCPAPRTQPVVPAPTFEAPPADPIPPATTEPVAPPAPAAPAGPAVVVDDPLYPTPTALTPEQKEALKGLIVQAVTLLVGALVGSGAASPFMAMILEKLLGAVKGANPATPPAAIPTRAKRRRSTKKKAAVKPATK